MDKTFLLYDSWQDDSDDDSDEDEDDVRLGRILIFATNENLMHLFRCETWFADGTFKTSPSLFYQLFSILGAAYQVGVNRKPQVVGLPFVHALLENKREVSYTKVLQIVRKKGHNLGLHVHDNLRVMCDFEYATLNAVRSVLEPTSVRCCFFHMCQSVYRRVVDEGLKTQYNGEDRNIKKCVHALCALAFVPADKVLEHFRTIRDELPDELDGVVDYFELNYIRRLKIKRRRGTAGIRMVYYPPRFPPELWNQYDAVLSGSARTNNISEGWHNRFQLVIGKHHPSLYAFFDELKKEQADTEIMLRQLQLGQRIRKGVEKSRREREELIRNVVDRYHEYVVNNNIFSYLKTVGYYVKF